jgi:CBS domain-containing protein
LSELPSCICPSCGWSNQCRDITQYLTASVQELGIGTYVSAPPDGEDKAKLFYPIATATLQTTVFDVVHMFSEQGISAVPIVDENGKVLNLYETVDVIVSAELFPVGVRESRSWSELRPSSGMAPTNHSTSPLRKHSSSRLSRRGDLLAEG